MRKRLAPALLLAGAALIDPASAEAKPARTLPGAMTGLWGWSAQSCAIAGDDGRVIVSTHSVAFFASAYRLQNVVAQADGALRAVATIAEEGEAGVSKGSIALKLASPDRLSIATDAAGAHVYIRCAHAR
jgi:hypothetical protein